MKEKRNHWKKGEKTKLAKMSNCSKTMLSRILQGQRGASETLGETLEKNAKALGLALTKEDFINPSKSKNPLITKNSPWKPGQKAELCQRAGCDRSLLSNTLAGRRSMSPKMADRVASQAKIMGLSLTRDDLLYPQESKNPLLRPRDRDDKN